MIENIKELLKHKELLVNLTSKELKLKYRNSIFGFVWSFLNPLLMLIIYTFAFKLILKIKIENFTVFLLSGLLPWTFFQSSVQMSTNSIVANANLIRKVYFPREIIPISIILSNFVNFLITLVVLFLAIAVFKVKVGVSLLFLPISLVLLLLFTVGLSLLLSSLNVLYRDISHFVEITFMAWFYVTPIVYNLNMIPEKYRFFLLLNPMTLVVECIRAPLYANHIPNLQYVTLLLILDIVLIVIGIKVFKNIEKRFAEEI